MYMHTCTCASARICASQTWIALGRVSQSCIGWRVTFLAMHIKAYRCDHSYKFCTCPKILQCPCQRFVTDWRPAQSLCQARARPRKIRSCCHPISWRKSAAQYRICASVPVFQQHSMHQTLRDALSAKMGRECMLPACSAR